VCGQDTCVDVAVLSFRGFRVVATDEVNDELAVVVATTGQGPGVAAPTRA